MAEKQSSKSGSDIFSDLRDDVEKLAQRSAAQDNAGSSSSPSQGDDVGGPTIVESFCVNCEENGITSLLLTRIPFFKEVILAAFNCEHCGYRNNEIQFGGTFGDEGVRYEVSVKSRRDLDRELVKSDSAIVRIPELDFEIPSDTQKGVLTTIEGMITKSIENLTEQQPVRRIMNPDIAEQIDAFVSKLEALLTGDAPFTFILDDIAGNSNIQNFSAPKTDANLKVIHYQRSREQDEQLGLYVAQDPNGGAQGKQIADESDKKKGKSIEGTSLAAQLKEYEPQLESFPEECHGCRREGEMRMLATRIPHFKEVVIMAYTCEYCGFRSTEVKAAGGIADHGRRLTLSVLSADDLTRDVLKSESARVIIPEVELEVTSGTLGGVFTTVEGLINVVHDQLKSISGFQLGDSSVSSDFTGMKAFLQQLRDLMTGEIPFTLIIEDPAANSYIQNFNAPDADPQIKDETFTRSDEEDEMLGLHHMKTENYEEDEEAKAEAAPSL